MPVVVLILLVFSVVFFALAVFPPVAPYHIRLQSAGLFCLALVQLLQHVPR